jgi:acyl-CoA synthetase (AMP-forming)/AMP-acid ligase II
MDIRQLLESRVRQHPEKAFLIFEDQVTSYADFDTTVNRVAYRNSADNSIVCYAHL